MVSSRSTPWDVTAVVVGLVPQAVGLRIAPAHRYAVVGLVRRRGALGAGQHTVVVDVGAAAPGVLGRVRRTDGYAVVGSAAGQVLFLGGVARHSAGHDRRDDRSAASSTHDSAIPPRPTVTRGCRSGARPGDIARDPGQRTGQREPLTSFSRLADIG